MKDKLWKWAEGKADTFQEIARDISWYSGKLRDGAKVSALKLGEKLKGLPVPQREKAEPSASLSRDWDPLQEEKELTKEMDRAIHQAYYQEAGFRYFGCKLVWYVTQILPAETDFRRMWIDGYSSCIAPMLRRVHKLEAKLDRLKAESGKVPLNLKNEDLLLKMRGFEKKAVDERLPADTGWALEEYKEALRRYAEELDVQLLTIFRLPEEN